MKFQGIIKVVLVGTLSTGLVLNLDSGKQAHAWGTNFMELDYQTEEAATKLSVQIPNDYLIYKLYGDPSKKAVKGVGKLFTDSGTSGSAFVIDDYTIITNKHVVTDNPLLEDIPTNGTSFYLGMVDYYNWIDKPFKAVKIVGVPNQDVAIITLDRKVTDFAPAMTLATEQEIKSLPKLSRIHSVGYPGEYNYQASYSAGYFLGYDKNYLTQANKMTINLGQSGSPIFTNDYKVTSVVSYTFLDTTVGDYATSKRSGGTPLTGKVRQYIEQYRK